jgi:hypothetical protein
MNRTYRENAGALGADQIDVEHQATDLAVDQPGWHSL